MTRLYTHRRATAVAVLVLFLLGLLSSQAHGSSLTRFALPAIGPLQPGIGVFGRLGSASDAERCRAAHAKRSRRCKRAHRKKRRVSHPLAPKAQPAPETVSILAAATTDEIRPNVVAEIEAVLATPCQDTRLLPSPEDLALLAEATLCLVNKERASNDEPPLATNSALQASAEAHSVEMVASDYFSHISPNGLAPAERALAAGYLANPLAGYTIGENIAWASGGQATPEAVVAAWINSPDHLENILDASYQDTGVGIAPQAPAILGRGRPGATYTQDFGVIEGG